MTIPRHKYFYYFAFLILLPLFGAAVGYLIFKVVRALGYGVGQIELEVITILTAMLFGYSGFVATRTYLKLDKLDNEKNKAKKEAE